MSKKRGERGSSPIQKISLQIYADLTDFLDKKRNVISKKGRGGGGGQGHLEVFQKKHQFLSRRSSLKPEIVKMGTLNKNGDPKTD